jgi:hypothetical protein
MLSGATYLSLQGIHSSTSIQDESEGETNFVTILRSHCGMVEWSMIMKWKQYVIEVTIAASSIGDNGYKGIKKITTYDISKK